MAELNALANDENAASMRWFFKTGPGEYGEGDKFIGVKNPAVRSAAKPFRSMPLEEVSELLASEIHEHRLAGVVILSEQAKRAARRGEFATQKQLYDFYLVHTDRITNWDLVDLSCRDVVGLYLLAKQDYRPLYRLAKSKLMWERRIAIVSTWTLIREGELMPTFELAEMLIDDDHDLMHKATGWMLREAGKRDEVALERFLKKHADELPRTALRYSIERMSKERRAYWLAYKS